MTEETARPASPRHEGLEPAPGPRQRPITVIEPTHGWRALDVAELWRYRELIYFLAWRDVKVRYKQTALGVAWALLQPLLAMAIFTVFFGGLARMPSDGLPYALFAYTGLLPWTYFANATTNASGSLVANSNLISKVYFPRLVIPLAGVAGGLVDLAIGFGMLVVLLVLFGVAPSANVVFLPLLVGLAVLSALSVGIWLSALDVQYRDVRYAIPFLIQVWLFATPVVYPASLVPEAYRPLYGLNPMAGVVEGFRWALLGHTAGPGPLLGVAVAVVLVLLVSGLFYFRRMERGFADVI
ncbi:MAG: ABC transporter permease [Chloroflexi bacterium]|nr:ABC transporter permease [Chloroflexota bacterium]